MRIVFYGDSITDCGRITEYDYSLRKFGGGYVRDVAGVLAKEYPGKYDIVNRGISGNRVVDLYARIKSDLWNLNPDIVSILIGVNDVWHNAKRNNGVEIDRYENVYRMLIQDTKKALPNTKIIMLEPFILDGTATKEYPEEFKKVYDYAKVCKKIAHENGAYFVPLQEKFNQAAEKYGAEYCLMDGVHPAIFGAGLIAEEWLKLFKSEIVK